MKAKAITYKGIARAARITATIAMAACAAVCLYAVIFMHRPDHLLTTAGYIAGVWAVNHKEKTEGTNPSR